MNNQNLYLHLYNYINNINEIWKIKLIFYFLIVALCNWKDCKFKEKRMQ